MADRILVAYATWTGFTGKVAEAIGEVLRDDDTEVDVLPVTDVTEVDSYNAAVIGSAIRKEELNPKAVAFLEKHRDTLSRIPVAYFVVCLTMREDTEEHRREVDGYLDAVREKLAEIRPVDVGLFAGGIDPKKLGFGLRLMLKLVPMPEGDHRDSDAIREWAAGLRPKLVSE